MTSSLSSTPRHEAEKILGVGVVGLGVGEQHAHAFKARPDCRVLWLCDHSEQQARVVRDRVGAGALAADLAAPLADPAVDIVSIASYDDMHYAEVKACFGAGKHVFVEKPLCRTLAEARDLKQAWLAAGRPHLRSNLVLREAPVYVWLKRLIDDGVLGRIYAFDGDYLYGRLHKITEGWRQDIENYSVMEGGGVHIIDLMLWLLGEQPTEVTTVGNRLCTEGTAFRYDDFQAATFAFPSGAIGRITANFGCVHRHHHVMRVFGTRGTFVLDDCGPRLHLAREDKLRAAPVDLPHLPASKGVLIPAFVDAIMAGADAAPAAQREFDLISVCAASALSHQTRRPATIEYV